MTPADLAPDMQAVLAAFAPFADLAGTIATPAAPKATASQIAAKADDLRLFGLSLLEDCIDQHAEAVTLTKGRGGLPRVADAQSALALEIRDSLIELKHALAPLIIRLATAEAEREAADAEEEDEA